MKSTLITCWRCQGPLSIGKTEAVCGSCKARYPVRDDILELAKNEHIEEYQKQKPNWYVVPQDKQRTIYRHQIMLRRELLRKALKDIIAKSKKEKLTFLDVGCGDGNSLEDIKDLKRLDLHGCDYNFLRLVRAKHRVPNATLMLADVSKPVIRKNSCDIILLNHVIEHVREDVKLLKKLHSYLAPGGYLLLGTPQEGTWVYQMRNRVLEPYIMFQTDHVHFYKDTELKEKMQRAGFTIEEFHYLNYSFPHSIIDKYLRKSKRVHDFMESFGKKHYPRAGAGALWAVLRKRA